MSKYRNIIFDVGGVMLEWAPAKFIGTEWPSHFAEIFHSLLWATYDGGWLTPEEVVAKLPEGIDKVVFRQLMVRLPTLLKPIPEMITLFHKLKERGYQVYILSNMPKEMHEELSKLHDFFNHVHGHVFSYQIKAIKPQPQIYQALLQKYDLQPHECLFIDDRIENIEAGRRCGIEGVVCADPRQVAQELQNLIK